MTPDESTSHVKRLTYRVDAGPETGLGHLARALAVSESFGRRPGWRVAWATAGGESVSSAALAAGVELVLVEARESEEAFLRRAASGAAAVVIDRKLPYRAAFVAELGGARPVVMLDVEGDAIFAASAAVFPTAHLDPTIEADARWAGSGRLHHGAQWVIVHPRVRVARREYPPRPEVTIALTAGGADPAGVSIAALDWLDAVERSFAVDLLVGSANQRREELGARAAAAKHVTRLVEDPAEFPRCLASATLAVATFGVTAYELAFLGVPALLVSHNEENARAAARFARWGTARDLGLASLVRQGQFAAEATRLLDAGAERADMRQAGQRLVDGNGAERIANLVEELVCKRGQ